MAGRLQYVAVVKTEFWNVDGIPSFGIAYHLDTWRLVTTATIEAACLL